HQAAGLRTDPPVSVPIDPAHNRAATAAPEPPELPPALSAVFHGLRTGPNPVDALVGPSANSCIPAFARMTAPAARNLRTSVASRSGTRSANTRLPAVVRRPAVSILSFREMGAPCRGPRTLPDRR